MGGGQVDVFVEHDPLGAGRRILRPDAEQVRQRRRSRGHRPHQIRRVAGAELVVAVDVAGQRRGRAAEHHRRRIDGTAAAVGGRQPPVRPAVVGHVLGDDELGAAEVDAWLERVTERLAREGLPLGSARRLHLAHGHVRSNRQHHDLAAGQIGLLLTARHARIGDAQHDFGAARVIPPRVAGNGWVIDGLEAAAEIELDPEVQVGPVAAARIVDTGLEAPLAVGLDDRDFVAAVAPEPRPPAQPRQEQLPVLDQRRTDDHG